MKVGIHQPNFFPHLAFFEKMKMCDVFVFLTHCQFEKNGYQNRFNIGDKWITMSVSKKTDRIVNKIYTNPWDDWTKIKKRFDRDLSEFDQYIGSRLSLTNTQIIAFIAGRMNLGVKMLFDWKTKFTGTQRLVKICKKYGATEYISGPSGRNYLDITLFEAAGIKVTFQDSSASKPILEVI